MAALVGAISLLLLALTGCANADHAPTSQALGALSSFAAGPAIEEPADIAIVACWEGAVRLEAPIVRAHPDGVRFSFENPGGAWAFDFHPVSHEYGSSSGGELRDAPEEFSWTLPPGEVIVACVPDEYASYSDPEAPTAVLTVVDPDGLYIPFDLICGFGEQTRVELDVLPSSDGAWHLFVDACPALGADGPR